jgi:glycerol-3-phosphate O-acyltransferase
MASSKISPAYEPNPMLSYAVRRFFEHIQVDEEWVQRVRSAARRGVVVYVLRNLSFIDFLALDYLTKTYQLPRIRFVQDMGLWVLQPLGRNWVQSIWQGEQGTVPERIESAIRMEGSGLLFLKRAPTLMEQSLGKGKRAASEGDESLRTLIRLQKRIEKPIFLVPQTFIWSKRPDKLNKGVFDLLFGPREWPGKLRTAGQLFANYKHVIFRTSEELDLSEVVGDAHVDDDEDVLVRRVTYAILTRLERERRGVLGPIKKPYDRIREEVLRTPKLQTVIHEMAGEGETERWLLTAKADRMLRELEAMPEVEATNALKAMLEAIIQRVYAGVDVDEAGLQAVGEACKQGTVVYLPSHKSHIDYLILSYVLNNANIQLPLIAAGDNLSFFPLGPLFRRGGAFFIRRSFKSDKLYAVVVDAYLRRLIRDGWAIEFFLEGGRSRTGKLLSPKYGLLNMVCDAVLSLPDKKVTFVPVSIGYERILEEGSYVREMKGGEKRKEGARSLLRGTRVLQGFYGRVNVQFGAPLTLEQARESMGLVPKGALTPAKRRSVVQRLAHLAMHEINRVTSVTPGAVVALVLLSHRKPGMTHVELVERCRAVVEHLSKQQARMSASLVTAGGHLRPEAIREAARLFVRGDLLEAHVPEDPNAEDGKQADRKGEQVVYRIPDNKRITLSLTKNIIVHFFINRALLSTALLLRSGPPCPEALMMERVQALSRWFKYEFMFRADATFEQIFRETLQNMLGHEELIRTKEGLLDFGPGHDGLPGQMWVTFYAETIRPFFAGYRVAARTLTLLLKGPMAEKDMVKKALAIGERMYLAGEITRLEGINRSILENAFNALRDQQYIVLHDGKWELSSSFATQDTVGIVEAQIRSFVPQVGRLLSEDEPD